MQAQAEAMEIARQTSLAALEEAQGPGPRGQRTRGRDRGEGAAASTLAGAGRRWRRRLGAQRDIENAVRQVQDKAQQQIDALSQKLAKVQADTSAEILRVNKGSRHQGRARAHREGPGRERGRDPGRERSACLTCCASFEDMQRAVEDKIEARAVQVEKSIPPPALPAPEPKAAEPAPAAAAARLKPADHPGRAAARDHRNPRRPARSSSRRRAARSSAPRSPARMARPRRSMCP